MQQIKIGIFGAGNRGLALAKDFQKLNCNIVAVCENRNEVKNEAIKTLGQDCKWFDTFDDMIKEDLDGVLLTNNFHEHTPYILKCMEKNINVLTECVSNATMAEGVALARAYKNTKSIVMLAENYPQMLFNREMKKVCEGGTLGKILFAEGEYNHTGKVGNPWIMRLLNYDPKHWRNYLPRSYYVTHSLAPLMNSTGATPKKVTAFNVGVPIPEESVTLTNNEDKAAIIMTQNDDGSIFRFVGNSAFGSTENCYRICGTKGQISNFNGDGEFVTLRYNEWDTPEGKAAYNKYRPTIKDKDEFLISQSAHGGGDFIMIRMFVELVKENKKPPFPYDLHSAITMASVGILAHRSALEGGKPYDIPDFTKEEDCKKYENDTLSPFYYSDGREPTIPCCVSNPDYKPSKEKIDKYLELLHSID